MAHPYTPLMTGSGDLNSLNLRPRQNRMRQAKPLWDVLWDTNKRNAIIEIVLKCSNLKQMMWRSAFSILNFPQNFCKIATKRQKFSRKCSKSLKNSDLTQENRTSTALSSRCWEVLLLCNRAKPIICNKMHETGKFAIKQAIKFVC